MAAQNLIDVSWDFEKFDQQTQSVIARMEAVFQKAKESSAAFIPLGSAGGFTELTQKVTDFNVTQENTLRLTKLQEQAEQARLRTQKLTQDALAAEARARKAVTDAAMKEAQAKEQASKGTTNTTDGGSRFSTASQAATSEQTAEFERLRQAEADATIAAAEYGQSVNANTGGIKRATAAEMELEKATLALKKANSEQNVELQGLNAQKQMANKAAKEEALNALGLLSPYQKLSKEYALAAMNAKDLAVEFGVDSIEAQSAAASALELNTQLQTIDKTVGQSQKNVGNYSGAFERALGRATNFSALAGRAVQMLSRQIIGLGVGMLSFAVGAKAIEYLGGLIAAAWNKVSDVVALSMANLKNLNDVMEDAHKKAGEQLNDLNLLKEAAEDANLPMKERLNAVKALQTEFPEYLKNISKETILNGEATDSYKKLRDAIIETSTAKAAKDKLDELESKRLDVVFQKEKIMNATTNELNSPKSTKVLSGSYGYNSSGAELSILTAEKQNTIIKNRRNAAIGEQDALDKSLAAQEAFLVKRIGISDLAKQVEDADTKKGKGKKGSVTLASTKEQLDLEFEFYKIDQARKIKLLDAEASNTKRTFDDRMSYAQAFFAASKELTEKTAQHEIDKHQTKYAELGINFGKSKGTERNNIAAEMSNEKKIIVLAIKQKNDAILSLQDELNKKQDDIAKEETARIKEALADSVKSIENVNKEQHGAIDALRATDKASHDKLLKDKALTQEQYDEKEKKSIQENLILSLKADLQKEESLRQLSIAQGESTTEIDNVITKIKAEIISAQNDGGKKPKPKKGNLEYQKEALQSGQDIATSLVDAKYQKEIEAINRIIDLNNYRKDQEIKAIGESTVSNQEKAAQMIILDKEVAANNRKLEREKVAIQIKQAKFDRDMAILSVIENTAIAVAASLKTPWLTIAVAAAGAAEIAAILAHPLPKMPQYAEGTDYHPGGAAIVGEGRYKELVTSPGGGSFIADHAMLLNNLPKGSKVIPLTKDVINEAMNYSMMVSTGQMLQAAERKTDSAIIAAIERGSQLTVQAMRKQKGANVVVHVNGSWNAYIDKAVRE